MLNYRSNWIVIIALTNVKSKNIRALLRLDLIIFLVKNFVKPLNKLLINHVKEIWLFNYLQIDTQPISPGDSNLEEL